MEKSYYKSPIGILEIICENEYLTSLKLVKQAGKTNKETTLIKTIKTQLGEYFSGKRNNFDIKIYPKGTEFQKKVWEEFCEDEDRYEDGLTELEGNVFGWYHIMWFIASYRRSCSV